MDTKLIEDMFENDSCDFLQAIYEESESYARVITPKFKEELKKYKEQKNEKRCNYEKALKLACKRNQYLKRDLMDAFDEYLEVINNENGYYTEGYYKQRSERWCSINDRVFEINKKAY
jgi:hypothetical protein